MIARAHTRRQADAVRSILLRRVDNLGDNVLILPVVREIRRHHPDATVTIMARPEGWDIYHGFADDFLVPESVADLEAKLGCYDLVFNVECSIPDGYVPAEAITTRGVRHVGTGSWDKLLYRGLLDGLASHGYRPRRGGPKIAVSQANATKARAWLENRFPRRRRPLLVAVNPGCGYKTKKWATAGFARVCDWLIREFDAHIVLLGRRAADPEVVGLRSALQADRCHLLTDRALGLVAAVLSRLDLHIGNDSGTAHVAAAVGIPTVTIFGPTASNVWRPAGRKAIVVQDRGPCLACGYERSKECAHRECLANIKASHVADGVLLAISKHLRRKALLCLDPLRVSDHLDMRDCEGGVVMRNERTDHACMISAGDDHVMSLLRTVHRERSYRTTLAARPQDRYLIDLLWMHRVLVSGRQGDGGVYL